ncbi:signal peptide protein : Signal peptide and transmembrane prediction OS=Pirellula staleyi (strain ATCC 27377 / DSM 6068 / ICPB 4128) GN=Psta_2567 PE=4 SV=1: ThuA [Gemmata massiliana]|uniref:ThuA-like domain-containing protein n=1 Tax=Gemmata massiliana TaxID=1210884 RepID=A0A6P2DHS4_9BACT|nr:ThuA domain-containing protein [Gemmata massiliana]VTS02436.1 signal peptide protein : Signal peptide and transmembrane prediction OS=Pirellula staleyi (strain ATCC 27377 / DSM 6068 / ICPB 4128) GN=Psta_2567 PE=4 SV=1: ThuA [Gemmata massiliana]
MKHIRFAALLALVALPALGRAEDKFVVLEGGDGPGKGKHIVLVSGDQEYRSEEALPQLAKILSKHHGFKCTVLFTVDPKDGTVNPNINNVPGLEALKTADLLVIFTRFLNLPDDQMQHVVDYVAAGKPVVGLRTATHAFNIPKDRKFAKFSWSNGEADFKQGFGKQVLGETWVAHHGSHGKEGTRGIIVKGHESHGILKGIAPGAIFGTTDVYTVTLPLPGDSTPLVLGEVTETLKPDSKAVNGKKNDPMMPVAWTKTYKGEGDKTGRVFTTTMGASQDLEFEGTRRLIVNGCFWAAGLESKIPDKTNVDLVGTFKPTAFKFKGNADWKPGVTPADLLK